MRYQSSQANIGEDVAIIANFLSGATVTVAVYSTTDSENWSSESLTAGVATEIGTTGVFSWPTTDLVTQPEVYTQYLVVFTDGDGQKFRQKFVKGGYVDSTSLADYNGAVHIDTADGTAGTAYPIGTARQPVSNYADALLIAAELGLKEFHIRGSITLTQAHVAWRFQSSTSALNDSVNINGQDVSNSSFNELNVSGACGGSVPKNISLDSCRAVAMTEFDGVMSGGGIQTSLGCAALGTILLRDMKFLGVGGTINANGAANVSWSGAAGIATVTNFTAVGGFFLMQADAVVLTFASSCTAGFYAVGGVGSLVNSGTISELQNQLRSKEDDYTNIIPAGLQVQGYTAARATAIDNLDATVSSRESESSASSRAATDQAEHDSTQSTLSTLSTSVGNLRSFPKNTAYNNFTFMMFDPSGAPMTGLTVTAQRSIDGAVLAACTNAVAEVGGGVYKINLSAADLNGDTILFKMTASGANTTAFTVLTEG